jgi:calcium-dependent protein kinase
MAPEVLKQNYTSQCDLWSMGVIVFILLSGHMPFYGKEKKQMQNILEGRFTMRSEHWQGVSITGKNFVNSLLQVNPNKRLTARTALRQAWIQSRCPDPQVDQQIIVSALRGWRVAPTLLRACMSMMAWSLSNEQQNVVREYFLAMDKNHDGAISLMELRKVMVDENGVPEEEVAAIFKTFAECHDKEIHYSDFLAAFSVQHIKPDDDLLHITFQKFDTRGVGYITAEDFHLVLGSTFNGDHAQLLVNEADVQCHDGKVDFNEFAEYVRIRQRELAGHNNAAPTLLESHGKHQTISPKGIRYAFEGTNPMMPSCSYCEQERFVRAGRQHMCCRLM